MLTKKQQELFDRCLIEDPDGSLLGILSFIPISTVYTKEWWITDIFGTKATFVKRKRYSKDGFCCVERYIKANTQDFVRLEKEAKSINNKKWRHYKNMLLKYN